MTELYITKFLMYKQIKMSNIYLAYKSHKIKITKKKNIRENLQFKHHDFSAFHCLYMYNQTICKY